jgi:hypothetical protein
MVPGPTAKHVVVLGQLMPDKALDVPDAWVDQLAPPSPECRMTPRSPALKQVLAVRQLTPARLAVVPVAPLVQAPPPLLVASAVPASPTSTQCEASTQLAADSGFPWGSGFCQTQLAVPVGMNAAARTGPACAITANARLKPAAIKRFCDQRRLPRIPSYPRHCRRQPSWESRVAQRME